MTIVIHEQALDQALARVEAARAWSPRLVSRLEALIRGADEPALHRINPLAFAAERGVTEAEAIDLLVHAAAAGLFRPDWLLICPNCACAVTSLARLGPILPTYHCPICHQDTPAALDEFIAVYFTVAPGVRSIAHHRPLELPARDYLVASRGVREGRMPDGMVYLDFVDRALRAVAFLEPNAVTELTFEAAPGTLQGFSIDVDAGFPLTVRDTPQPSPTRLELRFLGDEVELDAAEVDAGRLTLAIRNETDARTIFGVINLPPGFSHPHLSFDPFLSGQRLLMTQSFRDLFRVEAAGRAEGIAIRSIALLFTDLQGSTALYQQVGDLNALQIVQEHFGVLREVAAAHDGCIVKTIGDAVMAAFPTPRRAVEAALAMLRTTGAAGGRRTGLVLKAGVHFGAAVAVTLNEQLDYFGQTVNVAARVQALAEAGEIVLSDGVFGAAGVAEALAGHESASESARVRGFARPLIVHRLRPAA